MEFQRARMEPRRDAVAFDDSTSSGGGMGKWRPIAPAATVGLFVLAAVGVLYVANSLLMPITVALVVSMTLAPAVKFAARQGVPPWITGPVLVLLILAAAATAITVIGAPVGEWIARAPEIASTVREKLYVLDGPLSALRTLRESLIPAGEDAVKVDPANTNVLFPLMTYLTPALGQLVIFIGVLTFSLIAQIEFRRHVVSLFSGREAKLRALKIINDIEHHLTSYLTLVTAINLSLGLIVAAGAWAFGFANPIVFGVLAMVLNYVPYIGPAITTLILFVVGIVTFPALAQAAIPPLCFVALTTLEGQFITPAIVGRRLTLNPLLLILALAFWTWIWGPFGAFLAAPLSIVALVMFNHLAPADGKLPE